MKLTIVYDNEVYKENIGLVSDWGFSCLIETDNKIILFDTGAKGEILLNNMEKLGLNTADIRLIVISHEHWDHYGGLQMLSSLPNEIKLYRLAEEKPSENMHHISVEKPCKITQSVYSTGRLLGSPTDEQSLILKGKTGWYVLVGCSHPGVQTILNSAQQYGAIKGIIGGLHGFTDFSLLDDLNLVCASHCTQYKNKIQKLYFEKYVKSGVGRILEI